MNRYGLTIYWTNRALFNAQFWFKICSTESDNSCSCAIIRFTQVPQIFSKTIGVRNGSFNIQFSFRVKFVALKMFYVRILFRLFLKFKSLSRYWYKGGRGSCYPVHFPLASLVVQRSGLGPGLMIHTLCR